MFQRRYPELRFREFLAHAIRVMPISLFPFVADYREMWDRIRVDEVEFHACEDICADLKGERERERESVRHARRKHFVRSQKKHLLTFSVCTVIVLPLLREGHKRDVLDLFVQRHHHRGCGRRRHPGGLAAAAAAAVAVPLALRRCHLLSPSSVPKGVDVSILQERERERESE